MMLVLRSLATDVSFSTPSNGESFAAGSDVYVKVNASDAVGIAYVKLYINGVFVRQENIDPYEWKASQDHELDNMAPGSYTLTARAVDNNGYYRDSYITIYVGNGGCQNLTAAGEIGGSESECDSYDPAPISNVTLPSGGSGEIEYLWVSVTDYANTVYPSTWRVENGNGASFDPGTITQTTWYRRCARRSGCTEYSGESNWVKKEVTTCSTPPSVAGDCLNPNGSFEAGFDGYYTSGDARVATAASNITEGVKSARIGNGQGGISFGYDGSLGISAGDAFTLTVQAKVKESPSWAGFGVDYYDANGQEIGEAVVTVNSTSFQAYTISATAPEGTAYVGVWFWKSGSYGKFFFDELCLSKESPVTPGTPTELCNGVYVIEARHSSQALNLPYYAQTQGTQLVQYPYQGRTNQQFILESLGDGSYRIGVKHSGQYLDAYNNGTSNGTAVVQWGWHGGDNQRWLLEDAGNGFYNIKNASNGLCLDVSGNSQAYESRIHLWDCHGGNNQQFKLTALETDCGNTPRQAQIVSIGNRVWNDQNGNGSIDEGEAGIDGVIVDLYTATGISPIASTTTANNGYYLFPGIDINTHGTEFKAVINPQNFLTDGALEGSISSEGNAGDDDVDSDDNGIDNGARFTEGISSEIIVVNVGTEVETESDWDENVSDPAENNSSNLTVDFGFHCPPAQIVRAYATPEEEANIDIGSAHAFWMDFQGFVPNVPGTTEPTQKGPGPLATGAKLYWKFTTHGIARVDERAGIGRVTGELYNTKVPGLKAVLDLRLRDGKDWDGWKAANGGVAEAELFTAQGYQGKRDASGQRGPGTTEIMPTCEDHFNWYFYAVDNNSSVTFYNVSAGPDYDYMHGVTLQIKNLDDITKRVQLGIGGNDKDCDLSLGGWFLVEGDVTDPATGSNVHVKVQGDGNMDMEPEKIFDCPTLEEAPVVETARFAPVGQQVIQQATSFTVYPNPATDLLYVEGTHTTEGAYTLEIVEMSGRILLRQQSEGFNQTKIKVEDFVPGIYIARITDNRGNIHAFKFTKL